MKRARNRPPPERNDSKATACIAGYSAVAALFAAAPERVERLFFEERAKARVRGFCATLGRLRKSYRLVDADELSRIAGTPMHGGVVAIARPRPVHAFDHAQARDWAREGGLLLLLDGIGNPHNLGAIVRTAAFFGVRRIVLSDHPGQAAPSDASYRVAEGGFEHVEVFRVSSFAEAVKALRQSYRVVGTALDTSKPLSAVRPGDKPFALILGNEEGGLSRATLSVCDDVVAIPGAGRVQSLNVAATAAILIYALNPPSVIPPS